MKGKRKMTLEAMRKHAEEVLTREYDTAPKNLDEAFARVHADMNAKRMLEVLAAVDMLSEAEKEQLRAFPVWKDDMRELKPIKQKHGLSWSEIKMLVLKL